MEESAYIERLKSSYPAEGGDVLNEVLACADEAVRAFPQSAELWCIRGDLIQLGSEDSPYELADALASYARALAADPKCVEAYEGIGYFYDLVMDDEERAKPNFERAAELKGESSN